MMQIRTEQFFSTMGLIPNRDETTLLNEFGFDGFDRKWSQSKLKTIYSDWYQSGKSTRQFDTDFWYLFTEKAVIVFDEFENSFTYYDSSNPDAFYLVFMAALNGGTL